MRKVSKNNFWDKGISDRSFIMLASVITFFLFASIGMVASFFIEVNEVFLEILKMTSPVLMTITAATFSIDGVEKFTDRKTKQEIETIVETQVSNADVGREVSENVYGSIQMEDVNMDNINDKYNEVYKDEEPLDSTEDDSGEYLV